MKSFASSALLVFFLCAVSGCASLNFRDTSNSVRPAFESVELREKIKKWEDSDDENVFELIVVAGKVKEIQKSGSRIKTWDLVILPVNKIEDEDLDPVVKTYDDDLIKFIEMNKKKKLYFHYYRIYSLPDKIIHRYLVKVELR